MSAVKPAAYVALLEVRLAEIHAAADRLAAEADQ